jgi:transcriptional regulator GlxA family with amidase domain
MDQRVRAAVAFMNANLHRKLSAIEIAQSVRLSPAHLRALFKSETGTSPTTYRRELQMERARHLLETTFMSVKEVAACVGIDGVSHGSATSCAISKRNMERRRDVSIARQQTLTSLP